MQNKIVVLVIAFLLTACMPNMESKTADATYGPLIDMEKIRGPLPTSTPTVDEVGTAMMVLAKDAATSTSEAQATGTAYVVTGTAKAESTQAFWAGVTLAVGTQRATETQIAKTSVAGTEQANWQTGVPLTSTMIEATKIIEHDQLNAERVSIWVNKVSGSVLVLGVVLILLFLLYKGVRFGEAYGNAKSLQSVTFALKADEHGRLPLVPESSIPGGKLINPNLMHRATLDPNKADDLTPEQALGNTSNLRRLEAVRSVSKMPILRSAAKDLMRGEQQQAEPKAADVKITKPELPALDAPPLLPDFELLSNWNGGSRPLGLGLKGLITADAASPHILVAGKTGSGKTRYMLRTLTAAALASGTQVIHLGLSANGYGVFDNHPNYYRFSLDKQASDIVPYLERAYRELRDRDRLIGGADLTWDRWPGGTPPRPKILLLLEELGNLAETIYTDENNSDACKKMWSYVSMIAREGRKVGIEFVAAIQEPTAKSVDLRFRRNCTLVAFQLGDQTMSQTYLGATGAEKLNIGYFMAQVNGLVTGGGFSPDDQEIKLFLDARTVSKLQEPAWIDADIVNEDQLAVTDETQPAPVVVDVKTPALSADLEDARQKADETIKIQDLYIDYLNNRIKPNLAEIERKVYGKTGGSFHHGVKKAIALFEGVTVEEVNAAIEKHVASWSTTPGATTGLNGSESLNFGENPA